MTSAEIRQKFLEFFKSRGHVVVSSSSLLPDDSSVLLTTAGMQQFKKYYTSESDAMRDFASENTVSVQKCFRTSDIDEVGDETHLTFFEMLGNFSFGGYWKKEAITYAHEFLTKELNLPISFVTVFKGSDTVPKDEESREVWKSLGVMDVREQGIDDVFWGPTGNAGPCGPTTEIYCNNPAGGNAEIWNIVFNEFFCNDSREALLAGSATLEPLVAKGIDTGMGLERLTMISQNKENIFETDLFAPFLASLPAEFPEKIKRIIVDHLRGSIFLLVDGVRPSNKEAGYILRRLLRRIFAYEHRENMARHVLDALVHDVVHEYAEYYPELFTNAEVIRNQIASEREKFLKTIQSGMRELEKIEMLDAGSAFMLYETYGLPYEVIKEFGGDRARRLDRGAFDIEFKKHQEISRAGAEKKFGGHGLLLDTGELKAANEEELKRVTRLHTATHLLQAALRKVLGDEVKQMGSDITALRLRFDFTFARKLTQEEIVAIESTVNDAVQKSLPVQYVEMPLEEAKKTGALYFFKEKYPDTVKVYFAGDSLETAFSKEFCGGPHVSNTSEVGHFKITKEESISAGVRRIRATVG